MADKKFGAYICKGCGLGERLDASQLERIAKTDGKMNVIKSHEFLCNNDGVAMIKADIEGETLTHVMIAACSRRAKTEAFNFEGVAMTRANLREGVIWVRPDTSEAQETTQEMADDYIRMACAELKQMSAPTFSGQQEGRVPRILIVGGGMTGMTAALEAAKTGYEAVLVEKSGALGGVVANFVKRIPVRSPYADPQDTGLAELIQAIENNSKIKVYLNTTVSKTVGSPGRFEIELATESGASNSEKVGAIIQATGFKPFDKNILSEFSPACPDVVDQLELEALVKAANGGALKRPSDGKEIKSVAFIQCAGQRSEQPGHLSYCSGHCCATSIKQAMYFKEQNADIDTLVLFTDLRTPGAGGEDFYRSGQNKGVTFAKGKASAVEANNGKVTVKFRDLLLNDDVSMETDLVVLATGMVPNSGPNPYLVQDMELAKEKGEEEVVIRLQKEMDNAPPSILNLDYRQGTDVPHLVHGFTDSHFICFPYETRRTGIYTAGPVRRPMDLTQAQEDATGAVLKAIQSLENAAQGRAAHPRSGDLSYPSFRKEGCTQCKRCTVECPFGAINEDEQRYPVFNESRCRRCGTCMGACPVRVISFENYNVNTVGAALKAVDVPDEFSEKPRILVLACENDAYPALDMAGMNRIEYSAFVRIQPVRCLGSVNTQWLIDALNSGYDGVMLMGCQKGENYQCHFVKGSEMAHYRMSKVDDTLKTMNLETERVQTYEIAITDMHRVPQLINDMAATIEKIGMSPFKF
jgi:quinone-modifying oxidoreductase, subunit QmoB